MFQNQPNPNQIDRYFAQSRIDKNDSIDIITQKMIMNARDDAMIIKILEFKRKWDENIRKNKVTVKEEDINSVLSKFCVIAQRYIPAERVEEFIAEIAMLSRR